jgi:hypothetical protein
VRMFPALPEDPLLSYRIQGKLIFVTQAELRRVLKQSLIPLNLTSGYTFHAFRRSSASLAVSGDPGPRDLDLGGLVVLYSL